MNDATQHTIIEALVDKVRALEGDAESYRAQIERLSVASIDAPDVRDAAWSDVVQLCTEVLARADVNASTRRRAERILKAVQS